jgi:hypothetical protein
MRAVALSGSAPNECRFKIGSHSTCLTTLDERLLNAARNQDRALTAVQENTNEAGGTCLAPSEPPWPIWVPIKAYRCSL